MAKTGTLVDDFTGSKDTTTKWALVTLPAGPVFFSTPGGSTTQAGGDVDLNPADSSDNYAGYSSFDVDLDMQASQVSLEIPAGIGTSGSTLWLVVGDVPNGVMGHFAAIQIETNFGSEVVRCLWNNFGDNGNPTSEAYNAVDHRFVRARDTGSDVIYEKSPDYVTWTTMRQLSVDPGGPNPPATYDPLTHCLVGFYAQNFGGASGVAWLVDNFNTGGAAPASVFNPLSGRGGGAAQPLVS